MAPPREAREMMTAEVRPAGDVIARCPACDADASRAEVVRESRLAYDGRPFESRLVRCACGHAFINPRPGWGELAPFYGESYHTHAVSPAESGRLERWMATRMMGERFNHVKIAPGGRYLDVGCGSGDMVAAMGRLGMEAEGVEPSESAVAKARAAGLKVACGMLHDAAYPDDVFDTVSLFHALEHVPDPLEVLIECRRILRPGGELIVGVPNFDSMMRDLLGEDWGPWQMPIHLHQFSPASLRRVAERAGLEVRELKTESLADYFAGDLGNWLRRRYLIPRRLSRAAWPLRAWSARLCARSEAAGRGESIVATLGKPRSHDGGGPTS